MASTRQAITRPLSEPSGQGRELQIAGRRTEDEERQIVVVENKEDMDEEASAFSGFADGI